MRKILIPLILISILSLTPFTAFSETIDVHIKGVDDGLKTTKQRDYKEAVLFAKREAIERAGVKIKAMTTVKDLVLYSDYIESKAEAVLLPGYNILDMGYSADGTYQIVLIGKVKTVSEGLDSKELRYAKSLMDRGESSKARKIIADIMNNSKNDKVVAEAMYCQVLWKFASDERDTFEKLKAYYPNSKYVSRLKTLLDERERERKEKKRKRIEAERKRFTDNGDGTVSDIRTGLMWAAKDNGEDINWKDAKRFCENYRGGGHTDWRMPTIDELEKLYNENKSYRATQRNHNVHLTELIQLSACCPWASETRGSKAAFFRFEYGYRTCGSQSYSGAGRALPVRGGN